MRRPIVRAALLIGVVAALAACSQPSSAPQNAPAPAVTSAPVTAGQLTVENAVARRFFEAIAFDEDRFCFKPEPFRGEKDIRHAKIAPINAKLMGQLRRVSRNVMQSCQHDQANQSGIDRHSRQICAFC